MYLLGRSVDVRVLGGMDARVPPVLVKEDNFTPEEAAELLDVSTSEAEVMSKIISVPPCLPKAGEAYLFKPDSIRCNSKFLWDC